MSFRDIQGQDKTVALLQKYLSSPSLAGSYLFTGEEGIGKGFIARAFAKAANCLEREDDSCDHCSSCVRIDKDQHPDFHWLGLSDSDAIKIEFVRGLKKSIMLKPYEARKKAFIIDDAHALTPEASNALLKVLEEPPQDSLIILVTAKPGSLFKTVVSRCRVLKFRPLARETLKMALTGRYGLDSGLAHFLAYYCEGRMGAALKLKDTDILREKNKIIDDFVIAERSVPGAWENFSGRGRQGVRTHLNIAASWFRDLYLLKAGMPREELIHLDRGDALAVQVSRYSWPELEGIMRSISDALRQLERNVNVKLLLAHLKAEMCRN